MAENSYLKGKLSFLQIFYWLVFCSLQGFATVFFIARGISNQNIGLFLAFANTLSAITQSLTGVIVDKYPAWNLKRVMQASLSFCIVLLLFVLLTAKNGFLSSVFFALALVMILNLQPIVTSLIYTYINEGLNLSFSFTRGLGSLSFAICSFLVGRWLESHSTLTLPLLTISLILLLMVLVASLPTLKKVAAKEETIEGVSLSQLGKKYPSFFLFLIGTGILFIFHNLTFIYLPQILSPLQGTEKEIGYALSLAAFFEIPAMFAFHRIVKRFSIEKVLIFSSFFFFVKSALFFFATSMSAIYVAQMLQVFAFALYTPAYAHYINEWMSPSDRVKSQSFVMSAITIGNVLSSLIGGYVLKKFAVPGILVFGVVAAFLGSLIVIYSVFLKQKAEGLEKV